MNSDTVIAYGLLVMGVMGFLFGIAIGFSMADKTEVEILSTNKPIRMEIIKTDNKIDTTYIYKLK